MVAVLDLLDRSIALSSSVMFKAGTVRYVRIKGGGAGGLDRVRLRNNMPAPPGVNVQRGPKGGLFFDIAPDVDLDALEAAAQNAANGGGAQRPAGIAPAPQMRGQPQRTVNQPVQPAPAPAARQRTPKPERTPDTAGATSMGGMARKLHNLRALREAVRPKKAQLQQGLEAIRRDMNVVMQEAAAGRDITRNMGQIRVDADKAEMMARDVAGIEQEWREKNDAVQAEKKRQAGNVGRRGARDVRHQQRMEQWEQNQPLGTQGDAAMAMVKRPRRTLKPEEIVQVQTLKEAGLSERAGIHGDETFVVTVKPGTFEHRDNLSDTRICFKSVLQGPSETDNEVGASVVSDVLGWGVCPETVRAKVKVGQRFREGSAQRWSDDSGFGGKVLRADKYLDKHRDGGAIADPNNTQMRQSYMKMWVFDMVIGNTDRHSGNLCVDDSENRVWAIDNGYALARWNRGAAHYGDDHIAKTLNGNGMIPINMRPSAAEKQYVRGLIAHAVRMEPVLTAAVAKECPDGLQSFKSRMKALRAQRI